MSIPCHSIIVLDRAGGEASLSNLQGAPHFCATPLAAWLAFQSISWWCQSYGAAVIQAWHGGVFGKGIMVVDLSHSGTTVWSRDMLKMSVRTSLSLSAQSRRTSPGMLSGPVAFMWDRTLLTLVGVARRVSSSSCGRAFWTGVMFVVSNRA